MRGNIFGMLFSGYFVIKGIFLEQLFDFIHIYCFLSDYKRACSISRNTGTSLEHPKNLELSLPPPLPKPGIPEKTGTPPKKTRNTSQKTRNTSKFVCKLLRIPVNRKRKEI